MNTVKRIAVLLLAMALVASTAACVQSGPSSSSEAAPEEVAQSPAESADSDTQAPADAAEPAGDMTTITYWGWDSNFYEPTIPAFEAANPTIKVEATPLAHADYLTKIQQTVASGSKLPDILLGESNLRGKLFELDIWDDLTKEPYNASADMFFDFIQSRTLNYNGELVGIEQSLSPSAMAYKRDLATEYFGTDDRAELEAMFPTMESYVEQAKAVQEKSGGATFLFHSSGLVMEWLYFSDPTPVTNEAGELDFTGKMTGVLGNICALRDAGAIDNFQMGTPQGNAAYADANHIFYACPNWAIDYYIKSNDPNGSGNWGLMVPSTGGYSAGGTVMGVSKQSENKEAAWQFIKWCLMTQDGVDFLKESVNYYVPTKEFYEDGTYVNKEDPFFAGQDTGALFYNEIVPVIKVAAVSPYDTVMYDVTQLLAQSIMADTTLTAETALQKGIEEVQAKLPDVTVK